MIASKYKILARHAFTMVELLVVMAILAILVGLILAAVAKFQEVSSRVTCANNLQQIGLALHNHYQQFGVFPSNGGWDGQQTIKTVNGDTTTVWVHENYLNLTFVYGIGQPGLKPKDQTGSWAFAILPYLEQDNIFKKQDWSGAVLVYACPARRDPQVLPAVDDVNGSYQGGGWKWAHIDYAGNYLVIANRPKVLRQLDITDGMSQTIMAGEKAMNPTMYRTGTWYWDEPYFVGGSGGTQRGFGTKPDEGVTVIRDSADMGFAYRYNWGSAHPTGAHFLFCDGSVRLMPFGTDPTLVQALLTPAGGEKVSTDF